MCVPHNGTFGQYFQRSLRINVSYQVLRNNLDVQYFRSSKGDQSKLKFQDIAEEFEAYQEAVFFVSLAYLLNVLL